MRGDCSYSREIVKEVGLSEKADSWTVNYLLEEGGRYTGTLEVKETGVLFDTLYESSNKTIVKAIFVDVATFAAVGGHTVYRYSNDEKATIDLPAPEIVGLESHKVGDDQACGGHDEKRRIVRLRLRNVVGQETRGFHRVNHWAVVACP